MRFFVMFVTAVCVLFLISINSKVYCESVNLIGCIIVCYRLIVNRYASVHIAPHV